MHAQVLVAAVHQRCLSSEFTKIAEDGQIYTNLFSKHLHYLFLSFGLQF